VNRTSGEARAEGVQRGCGRGDAGEARTRRICMLRRLLPEAWLRTCRTRAHAAASGAAARLCANGSGAGRLIGLARKRMSRMVEKRVVKLNEAKQACATAVSIDGKQLDDVNLSREQHDDPLRSLTAIIGD
jgi:hypothetical protein